MPHICLQFVQRSPLRLLHCAKSPTECDAQLAESNFQTRSRGKLHK
ncbi:DUF6783 domain-containing protein [Blautia pseudococcoides]